MKAVHVAAKVNQAGALELREPLPEEFRSMDVEVLVHEPAGSDRDAVELLQELTGEGLLTEDNSRGAAGDWRRLTLEEFFKGYGESDAIYDDLR